MLRLVKWFSLLLLTPIIIHAQSSVTDQPSMTQISSPSPNAAALGKFGDVPVNLSTGIPQISIPLYNYKNVNNSLALDVELDYHAGGIKVDELASDIGIGWALNAGGAVMRTRRGIPDEIQNYGFMYDTLITDEIIGNRNNHYYSPNFYQQVAAGNYDGQNDLFSFCIGPLSGKFCFGKKGDFLMMTPSKVKIETKIVLDEIVSFTITDEKGTRYICDAMEESDNGTAANYHVHSSAWYVSRIIAPGATDSITFTYDQEWSRYTTGEFVTSTDDIVATMPDKTRETSYTTVITNGKRLRTINFPNSVTMNFNYDTQLRTDQDGGSQMYRLTQINLTDGQNTRGYNVYHDYSVGKLTLKKILPYDSFGETPGYEMSYYASLPKPLSNTQDHWGFYNSNPTGDLIPPYTSPQGIKLSGGNRSTDPDRVKSGSLTRIKYPTGGYTDFEMEANQAEDPRLIDSTYNIIKEKSYNKGMYLSNNAASTETFTFAGDAGSTGTFNVEIFQNGSCSGSSSCSFVIQLKNSANQVLKSTTIASDGSSQYKNYTFTVANMQPGTYSFYAYTQNMIYDNYINFTWTESHNNHPDTTITVVREWYIGGLRARSIKDYDGIHSWPASGRTYEYTKKNSTESSGAMGVKPEYFYDVFYQFHSLDHNKGELLPDDFNYYGYGISNYLVRASSSTQSLASINGSPVTYSRVVENYFNNGLSNGKKESYFTSYPSGGLAGYNPFPFTPPTYADWGYGQLQREVIYNANNDSVKTTVNVYQNYSDTYSNPTTRPLNFTCIALSPVIYEFYNPVSDNFTNWDQVRQPLYYLVRTFTPGAGRRDLVKSTVTEYQQGIAFSKEMTYTYDTAWNVKKTTQYNSNGELIETIKYFPYEYTTAIAQGMKAQNMYANDISTEVWKTIGTNRYLVNGFVNQYVATNTGYRIGSIDAFTNASPVITTSLGAFNPASFNRDANVFKSFISFGLYSPKGFFAEQGRIYDMKQAYLYGYNGNSVIAAAVNANAADLAYSSFEEDGKGNWAYAGTPATDATAISGTKVYALSAGAISRTGLAASKNYKVTYWSKNGAVSITGTNPIQGPTRNGWTLYEHVLPTGITSVILQGSATIDELRLYPVDASLSTYTYKLLYGVTTVCDERNSFNYYIYDGFGRLKVIKDQDQKILQEYDYQFQTSLTK